MFGLVCLNGPSGIMGKKIARTMTAFANNKGGRLLVGVADDEVLGPEPLFSHGDDLLGLLDDRVDETAQPHGHGRIAQVGQLSVQAGIAMAVGRP